MYCVIFKKPVKLYAKIMQKRVVSNSTQRGCEEAAKMQEEVNERKKERKIKRATDEGRGSL